MDENVNKSREEQSRGMKDLLLVVDMQNVYREGEPWACRNTETVAGKIEKLLKSEKADEVIFTVFEAPKNPTGCWKEYSREYADINADAYQNALMDIFLPYKEKYPVYSKSTYSSFSVAKVREAAERADRVVVCGVVAECCILATVESLIDSGTKVVYLKDAVAGQTEEFEQIVEKIVTSFSTMHTEVMTVEEYLADSHKRGGSV